MSSSKKRIMALICLILLPLFVLAQADYNAYYRQMRPPLDSLNFEEKISVLEDFLLRANQVADTVKIVHGKMYLANEYFLQGKFAQAMKLLLDAEVYAKKQDHTLLLGRTYHKKGAIFMVLKDYPDAIENFERSLAFSEIARDSQFIAISLEQLGSVYGNQDQFEAANCYYEMAIPMVKKFCSKKALAATLSNYGNLLCYQDSTERAIECYKAALAINEEIGEAYQINICKQNLALEYLHFKDYEAALQLLRESERSNKANGWRESLIYVYKVFSSIYEEMNLPDSALYYYQAYHNLTDSTIGAGVQNQISDLEFDLELRKKEVDLLKQKAAITQQQWRAKRLIIGGLLLLSLSGMIIWRLLRQRKKNRSRLKAHRERLMQMAQQLQTQNAKLRKHQEAHREPREQNDMPAIDPYEMRILTGEDWLSFKKLFEKSYPGFVQKLRTDFPQISEAEERLFLLLKLNLTNREIADILGIQAESVKKSRSRLRKRLELEKGTSLDQFIQQYDLS